MKSTNADLKKRGMASQQEIAAMSNASFEKLLETLHSEDACARSAAAINLKPAVDEAANGLLTQLSKEKCLYTRIAICESLETGGLETAEKMASYLGTIGTNQHKKPPEKVSAKKSFPLPRDIIARAMGKMDPTVFPVIGKLLKGKDTPKISEALDAAGYMVFYHPALATRENASYIIALTKRYADNPLILWKCMLCLSAFPSAESKAVLRKYAEQECILGMEAKRSLRLLSKGKN